MSVWEIYYSHKRKIWIDDIWEDLNKTREKFLNHHKDCLYMNLKDRSMQASEWKFCKPIKIYPNKIRQLVLLKNK